MLSLLTQELGITHFHRFGLPLAGEEVRDPVIPALSHASGGFSISKQIHNVPTHWPQLLAIVYRSAARPLLDLMLATTTSGLPSAFRSATAQSAAAGIPRNSVAQSSCDLDIKRHA